MAWGGSAPKFTPRVNHTWAARVWGGCKLRASPGRAALTLRQHEHHGQQRQDPMGTSGHVSAQHGGQLGVNTGVWGSGVRPPLLPALHPGRPRPRCFPLTFLRDPGRRRRCSRAGLPPLAQPAPGTQAPYVDVEFLPFPLEKFPDSFSSCTDLSAYVLPSVISVLFPLSTITSH